MDHFCGLRWRIPALGLAFATVAALLMPATATAETKYYQVQIHTSDISGAGTDADVHLTLFGTQTDPGGVKSAQDVQHDGRNFKTGAVENFTVPFDADIGELESIRLEHDNSGPGSAWHVNWVAVFEPSTGIPVFFTINRWLKKGSGAQLSATVKRDDHAAWKAGYVKKIPTPNGQWKLACSGGQGCTKELAQSFSINSSKSTTWSNTAKVSLQYKYSTSNFESELIGSKHELTVGAEDSFTKTRQVATAKNIGRSEKCTENFNFEKYNISYVWQWAVTTQIEGAPVEVRTCQAVCSHTAHPPNFLPGDPRSSDSCLVGRDFKTILNAGIPGHNTETLLGVSIPRCQQACRDRTWCKSFDYRRGDGACFLQDAGELDAALKSDYEGNPYDHFYLPERR